nr:MAG TPA: hypothetical protein [Caudoviricetes sp.]DAX89903.1 MAG TPA: hypothetical protein [Caudoviricetes sp.]
MENNDLILQEELNYTKAIRKQVVGAITNYGLDKVVTDPEMTENLLKTLKDMDTATLTQMRINSDKDNADKVVTAKLEVAKILSELNPNDIKIEQAKNSNKRSLDDLDGARDYVNEETAVGVADYNIDTFMERSNG